MKTALVSGAAGFIGSHLCEALLSRDFQVIGVDNFLTGNKNNLNQLNGNQNFRCITHDVIKPLPDDPGADKIDMIFHLASPASPNHHSKLSYHALPMETMLVNSLGVINMLDVAVKYQARFLFSSSSEIYGDPLEHPQKETYRGNTSTTGPRSVYDEAKRFGETITAYYNRDKGVDTRIVRIFNTFGPRMQKTDQRMIVNFIRQALTDEPITIYGDGAQTRSLCYVDDLVEGLLSYIFADNLAGTVINLGSNEEYTVMEYARKIKEITQSKSTIEITEPLPEDDPAKRKPDITLSKQLIGWEPKTSFAEGLKKMVEDVKRNP